MALQSRSVRRFLAASVAVAVLALGAAAVLTEGAAAQLLGAGGVGVREGTRGADALTGTGGGDVLAGLRGRDTLRGLGGHDTLVGGPGRDRLVGGAGDDMINARDGARDTIDCGRGWDTVVADGTDEVPAGCEEATIILTDAPAETGPVLDIQNNSVNNGGGRTAVEIEPRKELPTCAAEECTYTGFPPGAVVSILAVGNIGSEPSYGGDCANTGILGCRLTMDQDRIVVITFNGSG